MDAIGVMGGGGRRKRGNGDDGAAIVEMTMVGILLVFLLLGVVIFGYLMSFRQNMTQAAAEATRAGAVGADPVLDGRAAADQALKSFITNGCSAAGMTCSIVVPLTGCPSQPARQCVEVKLTYDYAGHPLLPDIPLVSSFFPSTIEAKSTAEINQ
jgi:Flp pilus assembly protein TadG